MPYMIPHANLSKIVIFSGSAASARLPAEYVKPRLQSGETISQKTKKPGQNIY
jgi:hypothetical protein